MTHSTDDELEAAAKLLADACMSDTVDDWHRDTAAMLRAIKGRVDLNPLKKWLAHEENICRAAGDRAGVIAYSRVLAKLAALDPAPDHAEWDDAIEAAAQKAEERFELCERDNTPPCYLRKCAIGGVLRSLKKGPRHD